MSGAMAAEGGQDITLRVPSALDGERVDRGLALLLEVTRSEASKLVADGRAFAGGRQVRASSTRLREGQLLQVRPAAVGTRGCEDVGIAVGAPELQARIVFVDSDLVVVDKPAGLVVHPGPGHAESTLVQQLTDRFPDMVLAGPDGDRPGVVHRLDKGTSGLLVVARTSAAREGLVKQMSERTTVRRYLAVVHGPLGKEEGLIEAPIGRSQSQRVKMAVVQGGRHARTRYLAVAASDDPLAVTLVTCRLETGRTHQVRVHFAAIGHAVLGDETYSKPHLHGVVRELLPGLRRPWLHAAYLGFTHPGTGSFLGFESPLPADLAETLGVLRLELPEGTPAL